MDFRVNKYITVPTLLRIFFVWIIDAVKLVKYIIACNVNLVCHLKVVGNEKEGGWEGAKRS